MSVSGKTVLITGATSGIGRAAALALAARGADLAVVGRDRGRLDALVSELDRRTGAGAATFVADLGDLGQVRSVAAEIASSLSRLDVLINNAGIAALRPRVGPDGFDEMLATNYLGPFLLTHELIPLLRESAPSRIVITGSEAHRLPGRVDADSFENLGRYRGPTAQLAYGRTKLLDVLFADELARRLAGTGVSVNSACPGLVGTGLVREVPGAAPVARVAARTPLVRTPAQGAAVLVRLADEVPDDVTGRFCTSTPGLGRLPSVRIRRDPAVAARIYERTLDLLGLDEKPAKRRAGAKGRS